MKQLWIKAIRESRPRFIMGALMMLFSCAVLTWVSSSIDDPVSASRLKEAAAAGFQAADVHQFIWWQMYAASLGFTWMMMGSFMAGAGMNTQTLYGNRQGTHPSMLFTLSLPIRRRDLVLTRSLVGAAAAVLLAYVPAVFLPLVSHFTTHHPLPFGDALIYSSFLAVGGMVLYWLGVLFASILDEQYQTYAGWLCGALIVLLGELAKVPFFSQLVNFSISATWILTRSIPWGTVGLELVLSTGLLVTALRIAEQREY